MWASSSSKVRRNIPNTTAGTGRTARATSRCTTITARIPIGARNPRPIRRLIKTPGPAAGGFPTSRRLLDHDLAHHAVVGVALAVRTDDAATQIGDPAGGDRHEPPFGDLSRIDLDLPDGALELGERRRLAVAVLHDLDLARVDQLREGVRAEIVRIAARVAQDELVELAGLEAQLVGHESVSARLAELDGDFDRLLARQIAGGVGGGRCCKQQCGGGE